MSREFLRKLRINPSTWKSLSKAMPLAGVIFGSAVVLKNFQEYKFVLHKVKTQGTISEAEADKIAENQGINRKDMYKEHFLTREKEKKALEASLLNKEWHNIRIPRADEGDPRSVQALRRLTILQEEHNKQEESEKVQQAEKRLTPLMAKTRDYLETAHKYLDAFNEHHKKNARILSPEEQVVQGMHFSEFFRKHLQKGRHILPKLEACLELGGLSNSQIEELKKVIEDMAKTNNEIMKCMKYTWDERDLYVASKK